MQLNHNYIYDINAGLPLLLVEKDSQENINNYLYAIGLYGRTGPEGMVFYHADGLGSVSVVSDVYCEPLNRYIYDPFGNPLTVNETVDNMFHFTGEPYDPSGLVFLRARYYDPSTGRFLTPDTLMGQLNDPLSQNLYVYCSNNPVFYIDPSGHIKVCEIAQQFWQWRENNFREQHLRAVDEAHKILMSQGITPQDPNYYQMLELYTRLFEDSYYVGMGSGGLKILGRGTVKAISLPSWKKVSIDMEHVLSGHTKGGSRVGPGSTKDLFPENMTAEQIEREIREAYRYGERIKTQGDTVKIKGNGGTLDIEMWVNTVTKEIETAYPIF